MSLDKQIIEQKQQRFPGEELVEMKKTLSKHKRGIKKTNMYYLLESVKTAY